jgi:excisionase family DNA binding protein
MNSPDNNANRSAPCRYAPARRRSREPMHFFTVAEVAECVDVSTRSVRRWIKGGELIAHHFGGAVRIAESDLKAFLAQHRDY